MPKPEAVILAAGRSRRMGCNKLLLPLGPTTVLGALLARFPFALFAEVILVCADGGVEEIARTFPVRILHNDDPDAGKSRSIRLALASGNDGRAVMFFVADQPLLREATIRRLVEIFTDNPGRIVLPIVTDVPANPVLFPADLRAELRQLRGDEGGRRVMQRYPARLLPVPFPSADEFMDIDTEQIYHRVVTRWRPGT